MITDRIRIFAAALRRCTASPGIMLFSFSGATAVGQPIEYQICGNKIYYTPNLKSFEHFLLEFLTGARTLILSTSDGGPDEDNFFIDFHQLLWNIVPRLPREQLMSFFADDEGVYVARTRTSIPTDHLTSGDALDSIILYYHQYSPKPIARFLNDYPSTEKEQLYPSLLRLALLDLIQLRTEEELSPALPVKTFVGSSSPRILTPSPAVSRRVNGLQRILDSIRRL